MEEQLNYNIETTFYRRNDSVVIDKLCNSVTIVNTGATAMTVNKVPLAAPVAPNLLGESFTFGGNRNEIFKGRIDIAFTGGAGQCIVAQKFYLPNNKK